MNCHEISTQLGFRCQPLSDGLLYVESPLTLSFDGQLIGAYVQEIGRGLVRITDNADIMFCAITHGLKPHARRADRIAAMASEAGLEFSDGGELHAVCKSEHAGFYLARFIEAASRVGDLCDEALMPKESRFERLVGGQLEAAFGKRIKRRHSLVGASGHQLEFPFVLDAGAPGQTIIQTVSTSRQGSPNWPSVYGAVGKMGDLKNAGDRSRRLVVLQRGDDISTTQAASALAEHASVILYENRDQLVGLLAA